MKHSLSPLSSLLFRREQTLIPQAANSQSVPDGLMACINSIDYQILMSIGVGSDTLSGGSVRGECRVTSTLHSS